MDTYKKSFQDANIPIVHRIALNCLKGFIFLSINDILYIESYGNFAFVHILSGYKCAVHHSLKELEHKLTPCGFCRIHNQYVINLYHLTKFCKKEGHLVHLTNKIILPVSRIKERNLVKTVGL